MVACYLCVTVTVTFKLLDVFVVIEHATRGILTCRLRSHSLAHWTLQQLREGCSKSGTEGTGERHL